MDWLKKLYEKLAFQNRYDRIKSWNLNPQQQALLDQIWKNLSPQLQKALWAFIALILSKYGPDAAKNIFANILSGIKKEGWVIEG